MFTPRERFIHALEPNKSLPGRVPHFELVFFLTMEAFCQIHPSKRGYAQWDQMAEKERQLHRNEMADYCFTSSPFLSPRLFRRFITPFLSRLTLTYREMGFYVIKHTDGNIMPSLDQLVESAPHALQSIDPMAGVDIAEVKRLVGDRVCLIGNVDCSMLDSGTPEEIIASTRYALHSGMPGGGYNFSTSNCIYTGMPLAN